MKNINDIYLDEFAKHFDIFSDNMNSGPIFNLQIGYKINKFKFGIGINYYLASITNMLDIVDDEADDVNVQMTLTNSATVPEIVFDYSILQTKNIKFDIGSSALFGFCKSLIKVEPDNFFQNEEYIYTSTGLGFKFFTVLSKRICNNFWLGIEAGYNSLITSDLKDDDGNKWIIDIVDNKTAMNLDFSGLYLSGKLFIII